MHTYTSLYSPITGEIEIIIVRNDTTRDSAHILIVEHHPMHREYGVSRYDCNDNPTGETIWYQSYREAFTAAHAAPATAL